MTKTQFLEAYRAELLARYPWAQNARKLAQFMQAVRDALYGSTDWSPREQSAAVTAWHAIGGEGVPTLKQLRSLEK